MKAGMIYRTNLSRIIAETTDMDLYNKKPNIVKKSIDSFNSNLRFAKKVGWKTYLHKKNESEESMCRRFTILTGSILPITMLIVDMEDCNEIHLNED